MRDAVVRVLMPVGVSMRVLMLGAMIVLAFHQIPSLPRLAHNERGQNQSYREPQFLS